jgi:hypothetical protein
MATLKIRPASAQEAKPNQTAKETWYADADGVPTTDAAKGVTRIAEAGQEILPHVVAKYGFEKGTVAEQTSKQMADDAKASAEAAQAERAAAEEAAAKGVSAQQAEAQAAAEKAAPKNAEAKSQAPAENKSAKK